MRSGHERIFDLWKDPTTQFIGANRASGYVTLDHSWYLTTQSKNIGNWPRKKAPIRWWQRADNSQVEEEIPNVRSVSIDRDISQDAGTCTVSLNNQWMKTNFAVQLANELGYPGYFTFNRGRSREARSRWQHTANTWVGKIVPGALLRTYQGYGGHDLTREEAVEQGYITLTGAWLVDDVTISAKTGLIELNCRDMMALLIDQTLYPPLVPSGVYPLRYQRWVDTTSKISYTPKKPTPAVYGVGDPVPVRYETSEVDAWYGPNFRLHGHRGTDSIDGNASTYYLSVGNSGPDRAFSVAYVQYGVGGAQVGAIQVHCWQGGYQMYVSVMEGGRWQGAEIVPYDESELYATQHTVDTGADIPFVKQVGCPTETLFTVQLPRVYRADRIRITFRHLVNSGIGPWLYRAGVREFKALGHNQLITAASTRPYGWGTIEAHPTGDGYWTMSYEGKIHTFGQCVFHGDQYGKTSNTYVDMATTADGGGYLVMNHKGELAAFGNATSYGHFARGETSGSNAVAIIYTYTYNGYWVIYRDGVVKNFGDAPDFGNITLASSKDVITDATAMTDAYGFWALCNNGHVYEKGSAPNYGQPADDPRFDANHGRGIIASRTGDGFMSLGFAGWTSGYGDIDSDAPFGTPGVGAVSVGYRPADGIYLEHSAINAANTGYWAINTEGEVFTRGDANRWGSPKEGAATIRRDGNYKDYADIVRDLLLWAGYWLKETLALNAAPQVYGNIEKTGIFSPEPLPADMFDKKPVIDPINQLKEIVGYICWVDDEGGFRWESPNWWQAGNFWDTGGHTDFIPEIDERIQLTDYKVRFGKDKDRSEIIITTDEPTAGFEDTITTRYRPSNSLLRGMSIPAMIKVPNEVTKAEQEIMAELIALHLWFARRIGNIACVANPALQINDQVRIFERVTAETFVHYIRGISSNHDFETGQYTMDITTNWLGTEDGNWAITAEKTSPPVGDQGPEPSAAEDRFVVSPRLIAFVNQLVKSPNKSSVPVTQSSDIDNPPVGDGVANFE
jgi:hypothetical protein